VSDEQRPDADLGENGGDDRASEAQRPRLDKDLLDVSLWWVLFWLVVAVAVLWSSEYLGIFPVLRILTTTLPVDPVSRRRGRLHSYATVVTILP
jgi:hypothetical protein